MNTICGWGNQQWTSEFINHILFLNLLSSDQEVKLSKNDSDLTFVCTHKSVAPRKIVTHGKHDPAIQILFLNHTGNF